MMTPSSDDKPETVDICGRPFEYVPGTPSRDVKRFLSHTVFPDDFDGEDPLKPCWLWGGATDERGYGKTSIGGYGTAIAHRLGYILFRGPVPDGLHLHHTCERKNCVNPFHLHPLNPRDHALTHPFGLTSVNSQKTHCKNGHPLSGDNLYVGPNGHRRCKTCHLEWSVNKRAEMRAERPVRTTCHLGHDITNDENVYVNRAGWRQCRICRRNNVLNYKARHANDPKLTPEQRGIRPHMRDWTHCKHGHEFTPENTLIIKGGRRCKICYEAQIKRANTKRQEWWAQEREKGKVCRKGHDITDPASVYITPDGRRSCRLCHDWRKKLRLAAKAEAAQVAASNQQD